MTVQAFERAVVRPLREDDVDAAQELAWQSLHDASEQYGFAMGPNDAASIARGRSRIRHLAGTDPSGTVVAELDDELVGVGLGLRRGGLWFLSLLAVRSGLQGAGIGRRLLDATLEHGRDCPTAMICASPDPKALRRYGRAGFALHAGYSASGIADRSELPAGLGIRDGDWERDTELVEQLITERRGEPYGPDLNWMREQGARLLVRDGPQPGDRAIALSRGGHVTAVIGASSVAAARVLWAVVTEAEEEVGLGYLTGNQQWAIDVALAARLSLKLSDTVCTRGLATPPTPYLPSGLFG